jgi:hypothetical protein
MPRVYGGHCVNALASPLFIAATLMLIVNDFVLKALVPGAVTEKLSDIAGVFAFAVFWMAIFPRHKRTVAIVVAAAFTAWKSPLVQPLIDGWNASMPFRIGRTVDATDLIALATLPFALHYARRDHKAAPRPARVAMVAVASLAFVATSFRSDVQFSEVFWYEGTSAQLVTALRNRGISVWEEGAGTADGDSTLDLSIPSTWCSDSVQAHVILMARPGRTQVSLTDMVYRCPRRRDERRLLYDAFLEQVVRPLHLTPDR